MKHFWNQHLNFTRTSEHKKKHLTTLSFNLATSRVERFQLFSLQLRTAVIEAKCKLWKCNFPMENKQKFNSDSVTLEFNFQSFSQLIFEVFIKELYTIEFQLKFTTSDAPNQVF